MAFARSIGRLARAWLCIVCTTRRNGHRRFG